MVCGKVTADVIFFIKALVSWHSRHTAADRCSVKKIFSRLRFTKDSTFSVHFLFLRSAHSYRRAEGQRVKRKGGVIAAPKVNVARVPSSGEAWELQGENNNIISSKFADRIKNLNGLHVARGPQFAHA